MSPIREACPLRNQARIPLFNAFIQISIGVIIAFTVIFIALGFFNAAIFQALSLIPFCAAIALKRRGALMTAKWLGILASIAIVLLQTNVVFTKETGFHFQLLALIVVSFLICDLKEPLERRASLVLAAIIGSGFFLAETVQFDGPLIQLTQETAQFFRCLSYVTTFSALSWLLYLYSTQLALKERELSHMADYDALTAIHNRGYFMRQGETVYQRAVSTAQPVSAILFDIDNFKKINDSYGHPTGDSVLIRLAQRLATDLGPEVLFARYGGEEFALLLPGSDLCAAHLLAEKLRRSVEALTIHTQCGPIHITVSMGVATAVVPTDTFDDIMRFADRELYVAKRSGKNRTASQCQEINEANRA